MPTTADLSWMRESNCSFMRARRVGGLWPGSRPTVELADTRDDFVELRVRQLRVDRQREDFAGGTLRFGRRALLVPQVREAWLQVEGQRVVDGRSDAVRLQVRLQG